MSIRRQCELLGLTGSTFYYTLAKESALNLDLMRLIDEQYLRTPFYGWPRMTLQLQKMGYAINPKRVRRLMQKMGLHALYPKRRTTIPDKEHRIYPYLLRGLEISRPNVVWCSDITYVPMIRDLCILLPSWTGSVGMYSPGKYRTAWILTFACAASTGATLWNS